MPEDTLFEFPCSFPIKVLGKNCRELQQQVNKIVKQHVADLSENAFKSRKSNKGNYISITITINATSKQQLDAIYLALNASPYVTMCL